MKCRGVVLDVLAIERFIASLPHTYFQGQPKISTS